MSGVSTFVCLLGVVLVRMVILRFFFLQETHSLDVVFIAVLFFFLVAVLRIIIIPWIRESKRIAFIADLVAKLLYGGVGFFLISYLFTLFFARTIFSDTLGKLIFPVGPSASATASWEWINSIPPRSDVLITFFVPLFYSIVIVSNIVAKRSRISDLKSWIGIESEIDKMNPRTNLVTLMAHLIGSLGAFTMLTKTSRLLILSIFLLGVSGVVLSLVNWYLTTIVFERCQFESENHKIRLVRKRRHRSVAWTLYNLSFLPFIWTIWGIIVMVIQNFL
jgi:hypothetical protein